MRVDGGKAVVYLNIRGKQQSLIAFERGITAVQQPVLSLRASEVQSL